MRVNFKAKVKKIIKAESRAYKMLQNAWYIIKLCYQKWYFLFKYPEVRIKVNELNNNCEHLPFKSQFFQDREIDQLLSAKINGFFIDVGANRPMQGSNSFFFEKYRNWKGIAVEPLSKYANDWEQIRPQTVFVQSACGDKNGHMDFVVIEPDKAGWEDMLSAAKDKVRPEDLLYPHKNMLVPIKTLDSILEANKVKTVDFVSIDVEGGEKGVLLGFNLEKYKPTLILLENTKNIVGCSDLRNYLKVHGYKFALRVNATDDIFIKG